jgi:hypothetical protein
MKQNKINKILFGIIILLTLFIVQQKLTEQNRTEYYICYWERSNFGGTFDGEQVAEYCSNYVERND